MVAKVYSYVRFSDASQSLGASSDRQGAYAAKWAADHGLALDEALSMRDEGLSAFHQRHVKQGALGVFLRAVDDGKVAPESVLIVEGLDRLSRADPIDAQAQLTAIISAGISVVTAEDGKVYSRANLKANPFDLIHSILKMIRANEESETKSRRVRDALRRQCQAWISGKSRDLVRFGNTPGWLRVVDGKWELIPERADGVRLAIDMFCRGIGAGRIAKELHAGGHAVSNGEPTSGHILRLLAQSALMGEKRIELVGETFVLENYYPAVIDAETFKAVQLLLGSRGRKAVMGRVPSILSGTGLLICGYCGSSMKAQMMANKAKADGTLADYYRRLQCVRVNSGVPCPVNGSCSSAPIERGLMRFCADLVNMELLYGTDRSALPRSAMTDARARLAAIEKGLARLVDAMVLSDEPVVTLTKKIRELEKERELVKLKAKDAEAALAALSRAGELVADERWKSLADGVERMDFEARMQARQLVSDTFDRIEVYHHGFIPAETPKGAMDIALLAKGGVRRTLRVGRDGSWIATDQTDNSREQASSDAEIRPDALIAT